MKFLACVFIVFFLTITSCVAVQKSHEITKALTPEDEINIIDLLDRVEVEEKIRCFLHAWNLRASVNDSNMRFWRWINDDGHYELLVTRVPVNLDDYLDVAEYKTCFLALSQQWYEITDSRRIRIFGDDAVKEIMWVDENGIFTTERQRR